MTPVSNEDIELRGSISILTLNHIDKVLKRNLKPENKLKKIQELITIYNAELYFLKRNKL